MMRLADNRIGTKVLYRFSPNQMFYFEDVIEQAGSLFSF